MKMNYRSFGTLMVALGAAACQGSIGAVGEMGAGGESARSSAGDTQNPAATYAPARIRRLSGAEVANSASDIFLGGIPLSASMPPERIRHRYDNFFDSLSVSIEVADSLQTYAQAVAAEALKTPARLLPCDLAKTGEGACVHQFLADYVRRTYRRPMSAEDESTLMGVFTTAREVFGFNESIGFVIEAMLQSPHFLFRGELGEVNRKGTVAHLDPYEVAAGLSYFIWRSTPDEPLLAQAQAGTLDTREGILREASRLLADKRAQTTMQEFLGQWLETNNLPALQQVTLYKTFTPDLATSMQAEVAAVADNLLWAPGVIGAIFGTTHTYADSALAKVYGVSGGAENGQGEVALDPTQRRGILTMPGVIASHSRPSGFSPVFLGRFVRTRLLCQPLPDPPANVPPLPPAVTGTTTRERFAQHSQSATCATCHTLMDPVGFGFEHFDGIGAYQASGIGGEVLTGKGELIETDVDGAFTGAAELDGKLAKSGMVARCFAAQLLELALGRDATSTPRADIDEHAITDALGTATSDQLELSKMVAAVVASETFVLRDASALP